MFERQIGMGIDPPTPEMMCMPAVKIRIARLFVSNVAGIHMRLAARLAKAAQQFNAEVEVTHDGWNASAKSIIGILTLGAGQGSSVTVTAKGHDADQAICTIEKLVMPELQSVQ